MFKKYILTSVTLLILISLTGCGAKTATPATPGTTGTSTEIPQASGTITETNSADNYQMLPLISGKVANVTLDANADGTTQPLKVGEVMAVVLESNPSTGYSWAATISNSSVVVQMGDPQYLEPSTPMPGAAGKEAFYFQAAASGTSTITFAYARSFEPNVTPDKTVTITVEVK